jgi:creatinine amidohydrolase
MLLQLSTWPEVESYLETSRGIIIPIGSTEQHGPTGLIGTDAICAEAIARQVGEEVTAMVAPTLNVGMALHHTAFPGTISFRPSTLMAVILDYVSCLARAGFERFFFINGHGGNMATLKAAFSETYYHLEPTGHEIRCQVGNWFMCRSVYQLARELYGDREGAHATPSEVALTQYLYPDYIKKAELSDTVASGYPIYGSRDFREHYPDGRMGSHPDLAAPEHGQQFFELAVKELSGNYREFIGRSRN